MSKLTKQQRAKVEKALHQHDRHKGCFFWKPFGGASTRRDTEKENTWSIQFKHAGHVYRYESDVSCSCRNYYYRGAFTADGERKTRAAFARLLK